MNKDQFEKPKHYRGQDLRTMSKEAILSRCPTRTWYRAPRSFQTLRVSQEITPKPTSPKEKRARSPKDLNRAPKKSKLDYGSSEVFPKPVSLPVREHIVIQAFSGPPPREPTIYVHPEPQDIPVLPERPPAIPNPFEKLASWEFAILVSHALNSKFEDLRPINRGST